MSETFWAGVNKRVEERRVADVPVSVERRVSERRVECPECGYDTTAYDHDGPQGVHAWIVWANEQAAA